jgi:hypothetical protein
MAEQPQKATKAQLSFALAQGERTRSWAWSARASKPSVSRVVQRGRRYAKGIAVVRGGMGTPMLAGGRWRRVGTGTHFRGAKGDDLSAFASAHGRGLVRNVTNEPNSDQVAGNA